MNYVAIAFFSYRDNSGATHPNKPAWLHRFLPPLASVHFYYLRGQYTWRAPSVLIVSFFSIWYFNMSSITWQYFFNDVVKTRVDACQLVMYWGTYIHTNYNPLSMFTRLSEFDFCWPQMSAPQTNRVHVLIIGNIAPSWDNFPHTVLSDPASKPSY